jgi:hypothetical protein
MVYVSGLQTGAREGVLGGTRTHLTEFVKCKIILSGDKH